MTERDLEQRLRAWYRADIDEQESAPAHIHQELAGLAKTAATRRRLVPGWSFPPMSRFVPLALAVTGLAVVILVGLSVFLRSTNVGPAPSHKATPTPEATAGSAGVWIKVPPRNQTHAGYSTTLLRDGRVLVAGGTGLSSAEIFDPTSQTWSPTGSMTRPRSNHQATLLSDGRVLVSAGAGDATAELYDPRTGSWAATGDMVEARRGFTATLLPDGRVLVAGGDESNTTTIPGRLTSAELYDPRTGTWQATADMHDVHDFHAAVALRDGRVLVAGQRLTAGPAELYDPTTETWSTTGDMIGRRTEATATLLRDGTVLVAGEAEQPIPQPAERYDPRTDTWTPTAPMLTPRGGHSAALLPDGSVLVVGGQFHLDARGGPMAELFDPASGSWSALDFEGRQLESATALSDGTLLVLGARGTAFIFQPRE